LCYIQRIKRFFLNNELLAKQEEQITALLDNRYPLVGNPKRSPWRNTILHDIRDKPQTLKLIRLIGEGNPDIKELMSYSGAARQTVVQTRQQIRRYCRDWQSRVVFDNEVQIDELFLRSKKQAGRKNDAVLVITSSDNKQCVYLPLADQKAAAIEKLIKQHVAAGCTIRTDGWVGYKGLANLGYDHKASLKDKLPAAHAAINSWRAFIGRDRRPEVALAGKCAHASFLYSHRNLGQARADALLDACMHLARPRCETGTHTVRLSIAPSRTEQDMLFRRLHHQDLFVRLLQHWARGKLYNTVSSKAWREASHKERIALWDAIGFSRKDLDSAATEILGSNPDAANYVDRATANSLVMETYTSFRKAAWGGHALPRAKPRTAWHGNNQRQGLRLLDGFIIHSTAKMKADHKLHIPLSWHSLGKKRKAYYDQRQDSLRRISIKREWVRGQMKWFVLLTFECLPYREEGYLNSVAKKDVIGLDVNKGGIGVAAPNGATTIDLSQLAKSLTAKADLLRSERDQLKERNPDWINSKRYWRLHNRFMRASRNARLTRDNAWRTVARSLRQAGATLVTEKDHVAAWKRGRARDTIVQSVAPARLKQLIKMEYAATGGSYVEVPAKVTKATATCPGCGTVEGKESRQRIHNCACGCTMGRDTAAAINLARYALGKKQSYLIRNQGVLQFGDAKASDPVGGQLMVTTISDTPTAMRSPSEKLCFYQHR
jgi:transposase